MAEHVDHPSHYGGKNNPYEAIKVIDAWELGFSLGNAVKYICRAGKKTSALEDLKKARWYIDHEIQKLEPKLEPSVTREMRCDQCLRTVHRDQPGEVCWFCNAGKFREVK